MYSDESIRVGSVAMNQNTDHVSLRGHSRVSQKQRVGREAEHVVNFDDITFFESVKRALNNKAVYENFLQTLSTFTQVSQMRGSVKTSRKMLRSVSQEVGLWWIVTSSIVSL